MPENGSLEVWVILAVDEKKHKQSETNESKMKVVGKSAASVNRVVDILMGVDAEFQVPMQGLELYARPGVKDFQAQNHWWRDDAELDDETGLWSLEIEGSIRSEKNRIPGNL